ncbi:hypothetical protein C6P42_003624, partial [Pichia californica]
SAYMKLFKQCAKLTELNTSNDHKKDNDSIEKDIPSWCVVPNNDNPYKLCLQSLKLKPQDYTKLDPSIHSDDDNNNNNNNNNNKNNNTDTNTTTSSTASSLLQRLAIPEDISLSDGKWLALKYLQINSDVALVQYKYLKSHIKITKIMKKYFSKPQVSEEDETEAAKMAVKRSITPTPNQIDKVVESVANATKRLSQHSNQSSSSKRKVENRVGPWRLGRTLGKGSTGRVRLAKHTITGQLAAIKIVPKNIIDFDNNTNNKTNNINNEKEKEKKKKRQKSDENGLPYGIEREIIIMKLISHPNIMALYDVWENKNELYLVLEYVEGGELFDFLINNGRLSEKDAVKYFRMIINGVSYCHKFNICHRDLKPENILLDKNGKIKIADFGMAALETQQKLLETSCGSPHYASPEIVAGKNYHGSPSDVWSCGIILFALLTGHLPFDDPNIRQLLLKVQTGKFHMPSNLSNEAKDLIWSMLRVNPNERIKIENISFHPLMCKYPDNSIDEVEDKLDHLDISKPIKKIDIDILNNLQTLWHGIPKNHIIKMLQNNDKNSEKMFYYLLENYKLTHSNSTETPSLTKSISKTALNSKINFKDNITTNQIPRSTSTIITTIQDENGKILKSETQQLKSSRSPLKPRNNINNNNNNLNKNKNRNTIVASTSFNKSVSFQRMKKDTSASTLSIVNMKRNLSILPDSSMSNLYDAKKYNSIIDHDHIIKEKDENLDDEKYNDKEGGKKADQSLNTDEEDIANLSAIIDNSDIANKRGLTVNPKDLPDLPDLNDYKYLMKTIFADSDISPKKNKNIQSSNNLVKEVKNTNINTLNTNSNNNKNIKTRIDNDLILLDIDDSTFTNDDLSSNTSLITSNYTSSLDPRNNSSFIKQDKSIKSIKSNKNLKNDLVSNNTSISSHKDLKLSKLELLKKELSITNPPNTHRNFSGIKSIKSSSTRKLNSFLQDEYKNVKIEDLNANHSNKNSLSTSYTHKADKSIDSRFISHEDTSYSLHSAVEIRLMTPTEEDLRNMGDNKNFEDADESLLNKKLMSDTAIKNNITVHRSIASNIDFQKGSNFRNSLISSSTNDENSEQSNNKILKYGNLNELVKIESQEKEIFKQNQLNDENVNNSDFDDADELPMPHFPNEADDTFDSDITGSMYTSVEEQTPLTDVNTVGTNKFMSSINSATGSSLRQNQVKSQMRPFSELKAGTRNSMTPTTDTTSSALPNTLRIFTPPRTAENSDVNKVNLSPIDAIPHEKQLNKVSANATPKQHAYRSYITDSANKPELPPRVIDAEKVKYNNSKLQHQNENISKNNESRHTNWFKKMFSAFTKKPSRNGNDNRTFMSQKPSNTKKSSNFFLKFNRSKFSQKVNTNTMKFSEHWLESDIITRDILIETLKTDTRTKLLQFTNVQETINGCNYTIEVTNMKTTIRAEVIDKVGAEYGFGGCYMKFVKLRGTKESFDYW